MYKCCFLVFGLGGLICECVGFEVCDVYLIYYGCMCLIEILEGLNIGLINSFVMFVCVNKYGFIEIFYCKVEDGKVIDEVSYMLVIEEMCYIVVQVNVLLDVDGKFNNEFVLICQLGEYMLVFCESVDLIDVLLKQLVLVVVLLILFFENDDVNCVFMGLNMQCQVVLLFQVEVLLVGIGIEEVVVCDLGVVIMVKCVGVIDQIDVICIVICVIVDLEVGDLGVDIYCLCKFQCLN